MGLGTDSIFIAALASDNLLSAQTGGRIYGTSIPLPDSGLDNVPLPYMIVTFDGLVNSERTKDDDYESDVDDVTIGIEVTAKTLAQLHDLTQQVRSVVRAYIGSNAAEKIADYTFSAQAIQYDFIKPCYWQTLVYQCEVNNITEEEDEQD